MIGIVALPVALGAWLLYKNYLHPSWRKQRRVLRACEEAFEEGDYRLECLHMSPGDPSIMDLFPSVPFFGPESSPRYFTYKIRILGTAEPDFSGMSRRDIQLVRRYVRRTVEVPHHGKTVLHPAEENVPASEPTNAQS